MDEARKPVDLNGTFSFKVDAKGRVSLPSKFRRALAEELVVTPDLEQKHLMVFEVEDFNDWVDRLFIDRFGEFKSSSATHLALRRELKARAFDVVIDNAGRILLPADQREAVGIERDVAIVGNKGYFEIWDAKRYGEQREKVDLTQLLTK